MTDVPSPSSEPSSGDGAAPNMVSAEALHREAGAWFARLRTPAVSGDTLEAFRIWRKKPGARAAYGEVEALWRRTGVLMGDVDIAAAVEAALERGEAHRTRMQALGPAALKLGLLSLASAALAGTLLAWPAMVGQAYRTRIGEQRLITLEDGTRLRLDTDSRVRVRLGRGERRLALEQGQAFFDVAHDATRPFLVEAGDATVRALGTRFDVRRDGASARVTLIQGKVRVTSKLVGAGVGVILAPGQSVVAGQRLSAPAAADVQAATSWTSGRIIFHAAPLAGAVAEVNRYSRRKVVLSGPVPDVRVTGAFDSGDTDAFVEAIGELHGLVARPGAKGEIVLSPSLTGDVGA